MKKYILLLFFTLIVIIGIFFFIRMGFHDSVALSDFPVAYNNYDQAIAEVAKVVLASNPEGTLNADRLFLNAEKALDILKTKAAARISSLTVNDGDIMKITHEIADLSAKELGALKSYQAARLSKSSDPDQLAAEIRRLASQRQTDYVRFRQLAGLDK